MELMTSRFGSISFCTDEVVRFEHGLEDLTDLRHWLLLADSGSSALCWLQSIAQPEVAIPVVSVTKTHPGYSTKIAVDRLSDPRICTDAPLIVLHRLEDTDDGLVMDEAVAIIIDPISRRAAQVSIERDNPAQHAPSEQVAPLRQFA